jgi:hypothetical protein
MCFHLPSDDPTPDLECSWMILQWPEHQCGRPGVSVSS